MTAKLHHLMHTSYINSGLQKSRARLIVQSVNNPHKPYILWNVIVNQNIIYFCRYILGWGLRPPTLDYVMVECGKHHGKHHYSLIHFIKCKYIFTWQDVYSGNLSNCTLKSQTIFSDQKITNTREFIFEDKYYFKKHKKLVLNTYMINVTIVNALLAQILLLQSVESENIFGII